MLVPLVVSVIVLIGIAGLAAGADTLAPWLSIVGCGLAVTRVMGAWQSAAGA